MKGRKFAWAVGLTMLLGVTAPGPGLASTIVPEGADDAWHSQPVTVTFRADGQPVVNQYRLDGDTYWREGPSVTVWEEGDSVLEYLSSNEAGTVLPVTDATFEADVLQHPGLALAEFWSPL